LGVKNIHTQISICNTQFIPQVGRGGKRLSAGKPQCPAFAIGFGVAS